MRTCMYILSDTSTVCGVSQLVRIVSIKCALSGPWPIRFTSARVRTRMYLYVRLRFDATIPERDRHVRGRERTARGASNGCRRRQGIEALVAAETEVR